jgi:drug/metabolite transporter (DMT)-like permease
MARSPESAGGLGGLGLALLAAATFGSSGAFGDALMSAGWSAGAAVTMRVVLAAALLTVPALLTLRGQWRPLWRSLWVSWPAIVSFGLVAVAGCQLCYFNAVAHLSVSVALLLEYSGTLLVVLWVWLRHGRRPGRRTVLGGLAALAGLVLVLDLTGSQRVSAVGVAWGVGAAVGLAVYFVVSAHARDQVPPLVLAWAGMLVGGVALGLLAAVGAIPWHSSTADVVLAHRHVSWLVAVLGLAVLAGGFAYAVGIAASRRLGATLATFAGLTEVLFATLYAWILLGQRPTVLQGVGGLAVLAGIALVRSADPGPADPALDEPAEELGVGALAP